MNRHYVVTKILFRKMLLAYALMLGARLLLAITPSGYSSSLEVAYRAEPQTWLLSHVWISYGLLILVLGASILSFVGLFLFWKWGRTLAVFTTFVGIAVSLFIGPVLSSPLESVLMEASNVIWGAILALAYWSSVKLEFN